MAAGVRLASVLLACARDDEADSALADARRDAARSLDPVAMARAELALAAAALARDDDAGAASHLTEASKAGPIDGVLAPVAWLVAARLARVAGRTPPPFERGVGEDAAAAEDRLVLQAEVALERASIAREDRDGKEARALLETAREAIAASGSPRLAAMFELEVGSFAAHLGDFDQARVRMRNAMESFAAYGFKRDEGRATIRYAELLASNLDRSVDESAAAVLGRAQAVLGRAATWRDRLAIRTGFHTYGRRVFDRVMNEGTSHRIEAFERARGALLSAVSAAAKSNERALVEVEVHANEGRDALGPLVGHARESAASAVSTTAEAIGQLDKAVRDLIDLIGAALVERDRLRVLLLVFSEMDQVSDVAALPPLVAKLATKLLDADYTVVALEKAGELAIAGEHGSSAPGSEREWIRAAQGAVEVNTSLRVRSEPPAINGRGHDTLCGPVIAVPLRRAGASGALYLDRLRRKGQFRDQDLAIAHLFADYAALALGKLRAREQESFAHHQLAVTLDAIRDGVIAVDEHGVIGSVNAACARMLRVPHEQLLGRPIERVAELASLVPMMTSAARVEGAVMRLAHGSFVVTTRPIGEDDGDGRGVVATLVELDRAQKMAQRLTATRARYNFGDIVGASPALHAAVAMAKRAAAIDATVLITGESGTGKEVIAQAIHGAGPRATGPFVGINCAALPRELLEAELFGYEKGAFTGARSEGNPGKFEMASDGTILLDEIGDMPLDMQAKLLRVLQERIVTRLGGRQEIPVNARVIATTHRDLEQLVDQGQFRMDLLFRLRVLAIELPPLRERPEDIVQLGLFHLRRFAEQQRKRLHDFGPKVIEELERYDWPGNVRELANVMEAEVSLAPPDIDVLDRLATRLVGRFRLPGAATTGEWRALPAQGPPDEPILPLAEVEKRAFLRALEKLGGSVSKAAEALGVSKVTFYSKLRSWGMHPKDRVDEDGMPLSGRWPAEAPSSSGRLPVKDDLGSTGPRSTRNIPTPRK